MIRASLIIISCLALAACGDSSAPVAEQDDDATARGEVLGGTISDDMLPLDTLRSKSPPLQQAEDQSDDSAATSDAQVATSPGDAAEVVATEAETSDGSASDPDLN